MAFSTMRPATVSVAFASLLMLAGCGGDDRPAAVFKPPSYSYLTKLRLNVGDIRIEDQTPPATGPNDLGPQSPTPPAQAMRKMAEDRLVAAGNTGTAVFTIDQASITGQPGGTLDGTLAAHLDIIGPSGGHNGYAEAHVSRQFVPGSTTDNDGLRSELYDLTNQMMSDMNVELEYQVRRTLGDWLLDASGAPIGAVVEQQPLSPAAPASVTPSTALPAVPAASNSVGAPMQLAPSTGGAMTAQPVAPAAGNASGPTQLAPPVQIPGQAQPANTASSTASPLAGSSPPPGFLRLPNGYLAPAGAAASGAPTPIAPAATLAPTPAPVTVPAQGATPSGY